MRDMLFAMPLGPMPGERVTPPVAVPANPADSWKPVKDKPHLEVNGLGQLRTNIPLPLFAEPVLMLGFVEDINRMTRKAMGIGSLPGCYCDGCNAWRKLGR